MNRLSELIHGFKTLLAFENWPQLFFDRIFFRKTATVVHRIGGMELVIDYSANEQSGTRACVGNLFYDCFVNVMDLSKGPINVIDAGANGGGFAPMLQLLGLKVGKLICVEMNPQTFSRLYFNITRNIGGEKKLILGAVCGRNGTQEVSLGRGSVSDSLYGEQQPSQCGEIEVKLYDFDELYRQLYENEEIVDICKIDIEGAEYEMLFEGECEKLKNCRYLIIEIHEHEKYDLDQVSEKLKESGFSLSPVRSQWEDTVFLFINEEIRKR